MKNTNTAYINQWVKICLCTLTIVAASCTKKLDEDYLNPDGFTNPSIEGLFANGQQTSGLFRLDYNEMWHTYGDYFNPMLGIGGTSSPDGYATFSWGYDAYSNAYSRLRPLRDMNLFISRLPADQQQGYQAFLWAGSIVKDYIFYDLTDKCGSVPYDSAMSAQNGQYFPAFDTQQDIYHALLNDLKDVAGKLKNFQLGTDAPSIAFGSSDLLFAGNMSLWRVFANSLRMRLAMRLTNTEPDLAKSTILEVLTDGQYANTPGDDITMVDKVNIPNGSGGGSGSVFRAFAERRGVLWLPQNMLGVLVKPGQPADPRLKVLFQPDKDGNYSPMPTEAADIAALSGKITSTDITKTYPSIYNRTTFETNFAMPQPVITSTEIHLIKAEAAIRWPDLGIDAVAEYKQAIQESIDKYYALNKMNNGAGVNVTGLIPAAQPVKPSTTDINTFLDAKTAEFTAAGADEKKGLIFDQKYIDFNVLKPYELWADTRRLFKELGARVIHAPSNMKQMERTLYPSSESTNNAKNFAAVARANNYITPVWWTGR